MSTYPTWTDRDLPVLVAVTNLKDAGADFAHQHDIVNRTGLDQADVGRALLALKRTGYITLVGADSDDPIGSVQEVTAKAYLATGLHPDGGDAVDRLLAGLRQAAQRVDDPAEKSRLQQLSGQAGSVSRDVLAAVLATVITGGMSG